MISKSKTLGEVIRELRDTKDLSLRDLAGKIEVSAPFLSDVEHGRRYPSDAKLEKIAEVLGISFSELKKYDNREVYADIKRLIQSDPTVGLAFRTTAEHLKSGRLTADAFLKQATSSKSKK